MSQERSEELSVRRRSVLAATAGGLTAGVLGSTGIGSVAAAQADETVTIIHDTHFHGRFQDSDDPAKNIVVYDAVVNDLREEYDNSLFLGNGDELAPSVLGLEFEGEHMIEVLNEMGPDAVGAGNHEFDFGVETAVDRFEESEFPWLVANLLTPEGEPIPGTERWTTVEVGDSTVGLFGLVVNGFHSITDYPGDYQVIDNIEAAQEATETLREEHDADLVICPAHISSRQQRRVAEAVDGLDAIVGSHSGIVFDEPALINGTVISEFGDEFDHLGRLTLDAETGDIVDWERIDFYDSESDEEPPGTHENHTPVDTSEVEGDENLGELVDGYLDDLEEQLGRTIVESEVELNASFDNYAVETGWGNLMTDLMRDVGDLDEEIHVATQNAGGIRSAATYGPGEITARDIVNILPFPNEIEVYELAGEHLYEYFENQVRPMPGDFGAQPSLQVSGISYEWWGHGGETEIHNVLVGGEPIDMDETYLVSTNDFEAGRTVIGEEGELVLASGQFQGAYTLDRLDEAVDTVAPEREHRMIRVDERVAAVEYALTGEDLTVTVSNTEASEGVIAETFRLLKPDGTTLEADSVSETDDEILVAFDADAVEAFVDANAPAPQLRLLGEFDPDSEYYGYEDDGELIEVPVSSGYENHKLQSELDVSETLEALADDPDDDPDDPDDPDDDPDDPDDPDDDPDDTDDSDDDPDYGADDTDDSDEVDGSDDADDDGPGFGPFAALAGAGGAAYLLSQRASEEDTTDTDCCE